MEILTKELRKTVQLQIKEALDKIIKGEIEDFEIKHLAYGVGVSLLESVGCDVDDEIDMNGWDADYWKNFTYKDKKFTLYGSGYYGGFSFELNEDEE